MKTKIASKTYLISNGVICTIDVYVPTFEYDEKELGREYDKKNRDMENFLDTLFYPQYKRAVKECVYKYENSKLPIKFLKGQKIRVTEMPVQEGIYAVYDNLKDEIIVDADTIAVGARKGVEGDFLYGYENGHRILKYKEAAKQAALEEVNSILGISDEKTATEILCYIFGYLIGGEKSRLDELPNLKKDGLVNSVLKLAWGL